MMQDTHEDTGFPSPPILGSQISNQIPCVACSEILTKSELEAHISAEHLDYFPYSCGHCGHHMPSEDLAHFHAQRRAHLPLKIREFPNVAKEKELRSMIQRCLAGVGYELVSSNQRQPEKQDHENSPTTSVSANDHQSSEVPSGSNAKHLKIETERQEDEEFSDTGTPPEEQTSNMSVLDKKRHKYRTADQEISKQGFEWMPTARAASHSSSASPADRDRNNFCPVIEKHSAMEAVSLVFEAEDLGRTKETLNLNRLGFIATSKSSENNEGQVVRKRKYQRKKYSAQRRSVRLSGKPEQKFEEIEEPESEERLSEQVSKEKTEAFTDKTEDSSRSTGGSEISLKLELSSVFSGDHSYTQKPCEALDYNSDDGTTTEMKSRRKEVQGEHSELNESTGNIFAKAEALMGPEANISEPYQNTDDSTDQPEGEDQPEETEEKVLEPKPKTSKRERKQCKICGTFVSLGRLESHVSKHVETRPLYACTYCDYKAASKGSVRVHISWRHTGYSVPAGTVDIGELGSTHVGMKELCFGDDDQSAMVQESSVANEEPALVIDEQLMEGDDGTSGKKCNICSHDVGKSEEQTHVNRHIQTRPQAGCAYCSFKGRTPHSIRTHITWRHPSRSGKQGIGIRDLSQVGATYESMFELCFGKLEQEATFHDPALVSKHMKICRPYARRATKSLGSKPVSFLSPAADPPALSSSSSAASKPVVKESWNKNARKVVQGNNPYSRKYMECTICGQSVLDALISGHIFKYHIKRKSTVQCGYCEYGSTYLKRPVQNHVRDAHPKCEEHIIDRRNKMHPEYVEWRKKCFPTMGNRSTSSTSPSKPSPGIVHHRPEKAVQWKRKGGKKMMRRSWAPDSTRTSTAPFNSKLKKKRCAQCLELVTDMWGVRHVWKHLEEEGKPKLECGALDCGFQTYLLKTLDTHCVQSHDANGAADVGFVDHDKDLKKDFEQMYADCFPKHEKRKEQPKMKSCIPKPYERVDEPDGEPEKSGPTISEVPLASMEDGNAFSLLLAVAQAQEENAAMEKKTKAQISPGGRSSSGDKKSEMAKGTSQSPASSQIRVIRCVSSPTQLDAWCNICSCTVNRTEIETHVWYAHLGGILPYRCPRCQNSFMTMEQIEAHWTLSHGNQGQQLNSFLPSSLPEPSSSAAQEPLEVIENPNARARFSQMITDCFPELMEFTNC